MQLKRRVLPNFEGASLLLFALLSAGAAHAQFTVGAPEKANAARPAAAASAPRAAERATEVSPALSGTSTPSGVTPPVGKDTSSNTATQGGPAAPATTPPAKP